MHLHPEAFLYIHTYTPVFTPLQYLSPSVEKKYSSESQYLCELRWKEKRMKDSYFASSEITGGLYLCLHNCLPYLKNPL